MKDRDLMDLAMRTATGNLTTTTMNYEEFMEVFDMTEVTPEIFENLHETDYIELITSLYMDIFLALKKVKDNK